MQEEIEHKTVNLAISTTKLSARTLLRGMQFLLRQYKYTSDYDPKNALDIEKFLNRKEKIHPDDTFIMVDADSLPPA